MFTISGGSKQFNMSLRYKDFFIDFLACLIPGFVFIIIATIIIGNIIFISFQFIHYSGTLKLLPTIEDLASLSNIFYFPFWGHVSIFILSYMFGFFLYRQDPKVPDHVSYLKNRKTVKGYNEWVIKNNEGLSIKEVQFPYCNLHNYLKSRGFNYDKEIIDWNCEKEEKNRDKDSFTKHRSKAYINKLKMRVSFFFPEALSAIIKNEAHIRFASSMWYGFTVLIKMLYLAIFIIFIFFNYLLLNTSSFKNTFLTSILTVNFSVNPANVLYLFDIVIFLFSLFIIINRINDSEISEQDHKHDEKFIDSMANKLVGIYRNFDLFPFVVSAFIALSLYLLISFKFIKEIDYAALLLFGSCTISIVSFLIFYVKQKIESTFHYQRVREIIYVIEVANLARVIKDRDINYLFSKMFHRGNRELLQ